MNGFRLSKKLNVVQRFSYTQAAQIFVLFQACRDLKLLVHVCLIMSQEKSRVRDQMTNFMVCTIKIFP